jgi:hypothetical protein
LQLVGADIRAITMALPMRSIRVIRCATLASAACTMLGLSLSPSASAAAGWLPPANLSAASEHGTQQPAVAVDGHGDAFAAWQHNVASTWTVEVSTRPADGTWQAPTPISGTLYGGADVKLAADASGDVVAVWNAFYYGFNGLGWYVQAAVRPAGGSWGAPATLSQWGRSPQAPRIALDPQGEAVAVWTQRLEAGVELGLVQAAVFSGGSWQAPKTLTEAVKTVGGAEVALDGEGNAVAVWSQGNATGRAIESATRPAGGTWHVPVQLSEPGTEGFLGQVAVDAAGDAVVVWGDGEPDYAIQSAMRPAGGTWQAPVKLSAPGVGTREPRVALDPVGDAIATWSVRGRVAVPAVLWSAFRPAGAAWQAPVDVAESGRIEETFVGFDALGDAFAGWENVSKTGELGAASAVRPAGGAWEPPSELPVELDSFAGDFLEPRFATDPLGDAVAVWSSTQTAVVQAAGYDDGPLLDDLSIPPTGTSGVPVSFSLSPLDGWAALGDTRWSFGDGSLASGASVTHTYVKAGTYHVQVESEDALGSKNTATGTITIEPKIERATYHAWVLSGTLTPHPRETPIALPAGSTFSGSGQLNTETDSGSVTGKLTVPPFTSRFKLFGVIPIRLGMTLATADPIAGSVTASKALAGTVTLTLPTELELGVTSLELLGVRIPLRCATTGEVTLGLVDELTPADLLQSGWRFAGTAAIPSFSCEGDAIDHLVALQLTSSLSGAGDAYSISIAPPVA